MSLLRKNFEEATIKDKGKYKFVVNSLTEQIPATDPKLIWEAGLELVKLGNFKNANKILGEEDKGGGITTVVSLLTGIPLAMARWYPNNLGGQIKVPFVCEYAEGNLYINGIEKDDNIVIVDDMISTGGTMIAMIKAVKKSGAKISDVVVVAEKIEYKGVERIKKETGIKPKVVMKISVEGDKIKIVR